MSIKGKGVLLAVGLMGSILAGAGPVLAQGHGGGGGHASGGGHAAGGSHASAGHSAAGAAHYASSAHYAGYGGARGYAAGYHGGYAGGHGAYGYPGHYGYGYGHGYSTGAYWRGGYWGGGYWPRAYYGAGFAWFLPVLPLAYATYWYSGVPYYYANDVYYTYSPDYSGYVATDPPPVADGGAAGGADVGAPNPGPAAGPGPAPGPGVAGQVFMYPKNGQTPEQQATDKAECQKWATDQAGRVAENGSDYQRAMVACVEGRGYSAR